jgi:hypothetical protein
MLRALVPFCALAGSAFAADVYFNDFNRPPGATYPEWTSAGYTWTANLAGTLAAGAGSGPVATTVSPNGKQRFLGEFGGPAILQAPPYDPRHFVRVDQTVTLTLRDLPPHATLTVAFDLYILKSWDGNNPNYGPDRWQLAVRNGPVLLDTTFSNNSKTAPYDLSLQDYRTLNSPPQASAASVNTLGYTFFGDAVYRLTFTFPHTAGSLALDFSSSLFEGKGLADESWGLGNVRISTATARARAGARRDRDGASMQVSARLYHHLGRIELVPFIAPDRHRLRLELLRRGRLGGAGNGALQNLGAELNFDRPVFAMVVPMNLGAVCF